MISLGIDPSLTGLGWVVHNGSVVGPRRVIAKGVASTPSSRPFVWRNAHQREVVAQVLRAYPEIEAVGCESVAFEESYSEGMYGLFCAVNEAIYMARKDVVYFDPGRVKLMAKGDPSVRRGRMDKSDIIEVCRADTGIQKWNHNEADAHIIARSAARFWLLFHGLITEDELTPSEIQTFTQVHKTIRGKNKGRVRKIGILHKEGKAFYRWSQLSDSDLRFEAPHGSN